MKDDFALAYARYSLAINSDSVTDEIRNEFNKCFKEEYEPIKPNIVSLVINMVFTHYAENDRLDLAKEECFKLEFEPYIPNKDLFSRILDFLSIKQEDDNQTQVQLMKDVVLFTKNNQEPCLNYLYRELYRIMLQRLLTMGTADDAGINFDPDFSNKVIGLFEEMKDVKSDVEFYIWYV